VEDWKNFFNIVFFVTISVVAILSYLQARKTLFSPIKTEIFKIQMEEFKSVLAFFNKRSSADFDEEFGFQEIFDLNSLRMQQEYIHTFFNEKVETSEQLKEKMRNSSYGIVISKEDAEEFFEEITPGSELKETTETKIKANLDPALKLAKWQKYKHAGVDYTKKYHEKSEELSKLSASPLLPEELTNLMYEFSGTIHNNLAQIGKTLTESSQEMQIKYRTADEIIKFNPSWIWNLYNNERKDVSETSAKILKYINEHLKINELMK